MPEPSPFNFEELLRQYGGQHSPEAYRRAVEEAGFEAHFLQGYVPTRVGAQFAQDRPEHGDLPRLYEESLRERQGLSTSGTPAKSTYAYWDAQRGVTVHAPAGSHFELYGGGGVKVVPGLLRREQAAVAAALPTRTSVFDQPATLQAPGTYEGKEFKQEQLAYTPAPGEEIESVGPVYHDDKRGIDVHAAPGSTFLKYKSGRVEQRPFGVQTPGEVREREAFGPSAEELGITSQTEIKGAEGQILRAPLKAQKTVGEVAKLPAGSVRPKTYRSETTGETKAYEDTPEYRRRFGGAPGTTVQAGEVGRAGDGGIPGQVSLPSLSKELLGSFGNLFGGVDEQALVQSLRDRPTQGVQDLYAAVQQQHGISSIRAQRDAVQKELKVIDDKFAEEKADIDENPWLAESLRTRKQNALAEKYETRRAQAVNRLQLYDSLLDDARQEAQFLVSAATQQANADRAFNMDLVQLAFQRADTKLNAQINLAQLGMQQEEAAFRRTQFGEGIRQFGAEQAFRERGFQEEVRQFNVQEARLRRGGGGGGTAGERAIAALASITGPVTSRFDANRGTDGYVAPAVYAKERRAAVGRNIDPGAFDELFSPELSPAERTRLLGDVYRVPQQSGFAGL